MLGQISEIGNRKQVKKNMKKINDFIGINRPNNIINEIILKILYWGGQSDVVN